MTVNGLGARLFAVWTTVTCILCLLTAFDLTNVGLFNATMLSFVIALTFFGLELVVYKTVSFKSIASPFVIASTY